MLEMTVMARASDEDTEIQLLLSIIELINGQINGTFFATLSKLLTHKKMPPDEYCISENGLLHKSVREDDLIISHASDTFIS